jgi:hypothetical protein
MACGRWAKRVCAFCKARRARLLIHGAGSVPLSKDVKQVSLDRNAEPEAYILVDQFVTDRPVTWVTFSPATMNMVVRTTVPRSTVAQ